MKNKLDGMKVHAGHGEVGFPNETYYGPIWTNGNQMFCLYRNELHEVKWVAKVGCWLRVAA